MSDERKEFLLKWLNTWVVTGGEVGPEEEKVYQQFLQLIKKHEGNDEEFLIPAQAKAIYDALDDPHKDGGTKLVWLENYLNRIIQQQPEIDDMDAYITEKTREIFNVAKWTEPSFPAGKIDQIITQVVSDVRGKK